VAVAFGTRLSAILFVAGALRGAVRGDDAVAGLTVAMLAAAFGFLPGLVAGGACERLAVEQAQREAKAQLAAKPDPGDAATGSESAINSAIEAA